MKTIKTMDGVEIGQLVASAKITLGKNYPATTSDKYAAAALLVALDTRRLLDRLESELGSLTSAVENLQQ